MRLVVLGTALALGAAASGCVTLVPDPGRARAEKPRVMGVPGVLYHPSRKVGLLANFEWPEERREMIVSGGRGEGAYSVAAGSEGEELRSVARRDLGVRTSLLHFPWDGSFFYWGLTGNHERSRAGYREHAADFAVVQRTTAVEWVDRTHTAGLTFGGSVVTKRDSHYYTTLGGVALEYAAYNERSFVNDGAAGGVDQQKRDATLAAYDDVRARLRTKLYGMVGFAF